MSLELTVDHLSAYERDGYTVVPNAFQSDECDRFVQYMLDLHAGRIAVEGFASRKSDDWSRLISRSLHHPLGMAWMLDSRLRQPLQTLLGDEPDGVQSMYFFKGSEQRRHQDAFYLPGCMSAWVALQEVNEQNGSIRIQVGSHRKPQLTKADFRKNADGKGSWHGWNQDEAFDELFSRNNLPEITIEASIGDAVFFHGGLIHRGGPILTTGSFRHSWAGHYIPRSYNPWPYEAAPRLRIDFDGVCRFTPTE
jgi:ectoine hydroxylase-related dioxygenase (phytanoyl-CoA dioxygenase family)